MCWLGSEIAMLPKLYYSVPLNCTSTREQFACDE